MTPTDDINHFLVTRDPKEQKTTVRKFGTDYDAAQDAYQEAEQQARGTNLDVMLLSAESLETIKRTHSSYFDEEPNIVGAAIGGALGGALGANGRWTGWRGAWRWGRWLAGSRKREGDPREHLAAKGNSPPYDLDLSKEPPKERTNKIKVRYHRAEIREHCPGTRSTRCQDLVSLAS